MKEQCMREALALAAKAHPLPNPRVGALIVKDGTVIGRGYHKRAGTSHAEVLAIEDAGTDAAGADLYVTLEPCCHRGGSKRTPPCTDLIIRTGIRRVFIASRDPNPRVSGGGIAILEEAGITVETGILAEEGQKLNEVYHWFQKTRLPWVHLKQAVSFDNFISKSPGTQTKISGAKADTIVHRLRACHQAILFGASTVRSDDPAGTVRMSKGKNPLRIVLDGKVPLGTRYRIFDTTEASTILFTTHRDRQREDNLISRGVRIIHIASMDLNRILKELGDLGILSILAEGGKKLASALLSRQLVRRYSIFVSQMKLGTGLQMFGDIPFSVFPGPWVVEQVDPIETDTHWVWKRI